jgi:1-phosphofructokinase family hexose kinase
MIVTLTPNPALDITYAVDSVTLGSSHRVGSVRERAGGKGLNVAAVLTSMGREALAVAPVGEASASFFRADLGARGMAHRLIESPSPTRRSIAVVDASGDATLFNEAGAPQPGAVWDAVEEAVAGAGAPGSVLTISGSLPGGAPADLVARLTEHAQRLGLLVVVDVGGAPLAAALAQCPAIVKPNRVEAQAALAAVHGSACRSGIDRDDVVSLARGLVDAGARAAIVSDGADGLYLVHHDVSLHARLREPLSGNPTGAGDALTAALAATVERHGGLPAGRDAWIEALRHGVAWSAAAVLQPVAGDVDPDDVERLLSAVEVEENPA